MNRYNHAYSICFSLENFDATGENPAPQQVRHAILDRLAALTDVELLEAIGVPHDTYVVPAIAPRQPEHQYLQKAHT